MASFIKGITANKLLSLIKTVDGDGSGLEAETASRWSFKRLFSWGGDLFGSGQVDGSENVTFNVEVNDDSHNHTLATLPEGLADWLAYAGKRNRLVNGAMLVSQENRDYTVSISSLSGRRYPVDQFYGYTNQAMDDNNGFTCRQMERADGAKMVRMWANSSGRTFDINVYISGLETRIEANNIYDLSRKPMTLSFTANVNWSGNLPVAFRTVGGQSYVVDVPVTAGENRYSVTAILDEDIVPGNEWALRVTIGACASSHYQTTAGQWVNGVYLATANSTQWFSDNTQFVELSEIQLEAGEVATPFERRKYSEVLEECQWYFEKIEALSVYANFGVGYVELSNQARVHIAHKGKRTVPNVSFSAPSSFRIIKEGSDVEVSALSAAYPSTTGFRFDLTPASALTVGQGIMLCANNDSTAYINLDARL